MDASPPALGVKNRRTCVHRSERPHSYPCEVYLNEAFPTEQAPFAKKQESSDGTWRPTSLSRYPRVVSEEAFVGFVTVELAGVAVSSPLKKRCLCA